MKTNTDKLEELANSGKLIRAGYLSQNALEIDGKKFMTGREWYDRFEKTLSDEVYGDTNHTNKVDCDSIPYTCTCDLLEVAKRASEL